MGSFSPVGIFESLTISEKDLYGAKLTLKTGMLNGLKADMDLLRFTGLIMLLVTGILLSDYSTRSLDAYQGLTTKYGIPSSEDMVYLNQLAVLASVQPVSIVVQDGLLRGTGHDRVLELHDPSAHAETEAIRDACRKLKEPVLRGGILYASRYPCTMCMNIIAHAGIRKVCITENNTVRAILIPQSH